MELGKPLTPSYQMLLQSSNHGASEVSGLDPLKNFRCKLRGNQLHEIEEMGSLTPHYSGFDMVLKCFHCMLWAFIYILFLHVILKALGSPQERIASEKQCSIPRSRRGLVV